MHCVALQLLAQEDWSLCVCQHDYVKLCDVLPCVMASCAKLKKTMNIPEQN